jgi:DNA-binding PadR family transcriptional regulator
MRDPRIDALLPLKPLVFRVLLALVGDDRHGWAIVRDLQQRAGGERILPANFYRTLRDMLAQGLIEESPRRHAAAGDERRRYFRLTALGAKAAAAEAARLEELVAESRAKRLLVEKSR